MVVPFGFEQKPPTTYGNDLALRAPAPPAIAPPPSFTTPTPPAAMGIEPAAYAAILYGKEIPKFVGGKALMGGRIVEGVFFGGTQEDPTVSFVAFHAIAANPGGTRTITSARLRGSEVWNSVSGYVDTSKVNNIEFRVGTKTQTPFSASVARYGAGAIAYRDGILSCWTDIHLKVFGGIVPFPSVEISDSSFGDPDDGITRQDAIEVILRDARLDDDQFEVSVPGFDPAWIVASQMTMLEFLQRLRSLYVQWNVTYDDKLRVTDPTSFGIAADITTATFAQSSMTFAKTDPLTIPREKRYNYIDIDRDFEPHTVMATEDIYPSPSTSSVDSQTIELPIVTTAAQATADINVSLYETLAARSTMEAELEPSLFGVVAGDVVRFADSPVINFIGRVAETEHDFNTYRTSIKAVEVLNCGVADGGFSAVQIAEDGYLRQATTAVSDASSVTWAGWVRLSDISMHPLFFNMFEDGGPYQDASIGFIFSDGTVGAYVTPADVTGPSDGLYFQSVPGAFTVDTWHHVFWSANLTTGEKHIFVDGVDVIDDGETVWGGAETIAIAGRDIYLPEYPTSRGGGEGDTPDIQYCDVQIWVGQCIDPSNPSNLAKFISGGAPVDTDEAASAFGTQTFLFSGDASEFPTNQGTGGAFTSSGAITDVAGPP